MATKKTIAIIDATGSVGSAIANRLAGTTCRLILMSNEAEKLQELEMNIVEGSRGTTEVISNNCAKDASWEADIIILANPHREQKEVAARIRDVAVGKIVISISNLLNDSYNGFISKTNRSAAEELQRLLPDSTVVKTFNTTFAAEFFTPVIDGKRADVFIASNNSKALDEVSEIISSAGFNPMVVGDLSMSSALEQMEQLIVKLGKGNFIWLAGWKALRNG